MLLREWAAINYGGCYFREQVRLGPTTEHVVGVQIDPTLERMLRVWNWYCDAVIITPAEGLIVEAKVHPDPGAIGQVLFYRQLMISTPELSSWLSTPFWPVVLFAEEDDGVRQFARSLGVRMEVYTPQWIADYLVAVQFRHRGTASPGSTEGAA